jgi:Ca-activated chloride channel family protein
MSAFRRLLLSVLSLPVPALAAAQGIVLPRPCIGIIIGDRRPIPECPAPQTGARVVRTRSDVRIDLVDGVLRYVVEERFRNTGGRVGEADYLFPLPRGAAFQDLQLEINGELVAGETMNATDARAIYEEIVRRQRDPALVEWMGHGLLRARIFPIAPGEEKSVVVRFQSVAAREGDAVRVDYSGGKREEGRGKSEIGTLTLSYPAGNGFGRAYSPTHDLNLDERGGRRRVDVRGDPHDVTILIPVRRAAEPSIAMLPYSPGGEDGFALITIAPPAGDDRGSATTARDVTVVLDVSGSMQGTKMTQARAAARQVLETLTPRDRFRLVDFATDVHTFRDDFSAVTTENLRAARDYIDRLEAQGSTNIEGALRAAFDSRQAAASSRGSLSLVLFITDGEPTVGERRPEALVDLARPTRDDPGRSPARVFTFGVGSDVNVTLLEQMALEGRGTAQFVRPDESVERAVGLVASRLVDPVLTDLTIRTEGNVRLSRVLPPRGTDLFAGQDLVVLARYSGDGPSRIIVEGTRRGSTVRWTENVTFPERDRGNAFVARLWATQRVGYLAAEKRRSVGGGGSNTEIDREIRELGERYGIPTEFTSYFVREPGMPVPRPMGAVGGRGGGGGAPPMAVAGAAFGSAKTAVFEAARSDARLRSVTSLADSAMSVSRDAAANGARMVAGRRFSLRDSVWTDSRYTSSMRTVTIRPYSKAWFDIVARIPELKAVFAIGDQVVVAGRSVAIAVSANGVERLSDAELVQLAGQW